MRNALVDALVARASDPALVFLTGDLGFMALEPLRDALGERFINAGLSEQNMLGVAAALARSGFDAWVYSIAPFCYARAFEQIRNDVVFHRAPVKIVGNGAGYGYGVMGPTHHAIEDYGVLLTLQEIAIYAPAFDDDVAAVVDRARGDGGPAYIRLGIEESAPDAKSATYHAWRRLTDGGGPPVIAFGSIAGAYRRAFEQIAQPARPNLWVLTELPLERHPLPGLLLEQIAVAPTLYVVEEHVAHGGLASALGLHLLATGIAPRQLRSLHARAHHYDRFGSQAYLRRQSGLDPESLVAELTS